MGGTSERKIRREGQGGVRDEVCGGRAGAGFRIGVALGARSGVGERVRRKYRVGIRVKVGKESRAESGARSGTRVGTEIELKARTRVGTGSQSERGGIQTLGSWLEGEAVLGSGPG